MHRLDRFNQTKTRCLKITSNRWVKLLWAANDAYLKCGATAGSLCQQDAICDKAHSRKHDMELPDE